MSASIDQQFVEYVVKSLVEHPDDVKIDRRVDEKGVLLELTVHPDDLGRVIGKRGATAQSLRTLLRALGTKQEARYNLKIVDVDRLDENGNPIERPVRQAADFNSQASAAAVVPNDPVVAVDDNSPGDDTALETAEEKREEKQSDSLARTRAELAELDDLDV